MDSAIDVIPTVLNHLGKSPDSTDEADLALVARTLAAIRPHIAQRYFNLLCIAVGSDLVRYSVFLPVDRQAGPVDLPKNRYDFCLQLAAPERSEFNQLKNAFHQLIRDKHVDLALLKQVRTIEWLADD